MKKWIRWQGLAGFAAVVIIVGAFWFFLIDVLVKRGIEAGGTRLAGARVELAKADVSLFPLGITLTGLQVTDKGAPMKNAVEVSRIAFTLDGLNLLRRKVIIQEMTAEGFRFGTPRKTSGAVAKPEKKPGPAKGPSFPLPPLERPDVKKILKDEKLESLRQIESARADMKARKSAWNKRVDELPDKKAVEAYKVRIDKLKRGKSSSLNEQIAEAVAIKSDIDRDLGTIKKIRDAFNADLASAKELLARAEKAPHDDVRRIMDKYGFSKTGLVNMSSALFGGKIGSWVQQGFLWYGRLQPVLARSQEQKKGGPDVVQPLRGRGVDVRFKEYRPLPDFLIKTVKASFLPAAGTFTGTIKNITPDQDVLGAPMSVAFSGEGMQDIRTAKLNGVFNHVRPSKPEDTLTLNVQGYRVQDMALADAGMVPLSLTDGLVDFALNGASRGATFSARITATVKSVRFATGDKDGSNPYSRAIASALSKVSSFTLTADVAGTFEKYDVRISSNLDRVLQDAVGKLVKEQSAKFEQELAAAVAEKTGSALGDLKKSYGDLDAVGGSLSSRQNQLSDLLKNVGKSGLPGKFKLPF